MSKKQDQPSPPLPSPPQDGQNPQKAAMMMNAGAELGPIQGPPPGEEGGGERGGGEGGGEEEGESEGEEEGPLAGSGKRWSLAQLRAGEATVPVQSGTNKFASQKGSTGFGTPRDVKGKHLKRIWELEYPEECEGH